MVAVAEKIPVMPEDLTANDLGKWKTSFEPKTLYSRSNENLQIKRVGILIRKQNNFTFTTRYMATGKTKTDKTWQKWVTLNQVSFTLKNGKLNIFFMGKSSGNVQFKSVVNISRRLFLVTKNFLYPHVETGKFIIDEIVNLYTRNGLVSSLTVLPVVNEIEKLANHVENALLRDVYPAWGELTSDYVTITGKPTDAITPPQYLAQATKETAKIDTLYDDLLLDKEGKAYQMLKENPDLFRDTRVSLPIVLSRKLISDRLREKMLVDILKNKIKETKAYEKGTSKTDSSVIFPHRRRRRENSVDIPFIKERQIYNDLSLNDLTRVKTLLKLVPETQRMKFCSSLADLKNDTAGIAVTSQTSIYKLTKLWESSKDKADPKLVKDALVLKKDNSASNYLSIISEIIEKGERSEESMIDEIIAFGEMLVDSGLFNKPGWWSSDVTLKYPKYAGIQRTQTVLPIPRHEKPDAAIYAKKVKYQITPLHINVKNEFGKRKTIFTDVIRDEKIQYFTEGNSYAFEVKLSGLYQYMIAMKKKAVVELLANGLEANNKNIAAWFYAIHAMEAMTLTQSLYLPRKWFTLYKEGFSPWMSMYVVMHRIAVKTVMPMKGLPEKWLATTLGLNSNSENNQAGF